MPWVLRTLLATRICSSRPAFSGMPEPPLARQVLMVNCRPPWKPLPVLVDQLPPDSQAATASQSTLSALAVPASANGVIASAPAKVARPIVLRMFFNFDPFDERAPPTPRADARRHA